MRQTVGILGTPIDVLNTEAVLVRLEQFIEERRFHQIATANTDFLINAIEDPELMTILRNADLVMPDGMPLVWASRMMRSPLPERVTGADIVPALAALSAQKGYRLYMLGARPEVAQRAKERMETNYPGIQIVGCVSPPLASLIEMDSASLLEDIQRARPDILLVAFGNPKQEKWIHLHREALSDVPVCIGVGGTFDFMAGQTSRAPVWMQRSGLEWIYRLGQEPRRLWRRYTRDIWQFGRYLLWQWWALRHKSRGETVEIHAALSGDCTVVSILGALEGPALPRFRMVAEEAFNAGTHLILDLHGVTAIDGEALGVFLNLPKRAAHFEREVRLVAAPQTVMEALRRSQLQDGPFRIVPSLAQAFSNEPQTGLCWRVLCGRIAAVVEVGGSSDVATVRLLEQSCARLLEAGKRVDLDGRGILYADACLLSALLRLSQAYRGPTGSCLRLVPGDALRQAMAREKVTSQFELRETPELPPDAVEGTPEFLESQVAGSV